MESIDQQPPTINFTENIFKPSNEGNYMMEDFIILKLKQIISYSLDNYLLDNAIFFAERLKVYYIKGNVQSEDNLMILAQCFYLQQSYKKVYHLLKECQSVSCRILFAKACLELNYLSEGEQSLNAILRDESQKNLKNAFGRSESLYSSSDSLPNAGTCKKPDLSIVYLYLGKICRKANRHAQAISYYEQALEQNPMLWVAYEDLCQLGASKSPTDIFQVNQVSNEYIWKNTDGDERNFQFNNSSTPNSPNTPIRSKELQAAFEHTPIPEYTPSNLSNSSLPLSPSFASLQAQTLSNSMASLSRATLSKSKKDEAKKKGTRLFSVETSPTPEVRRSSRLQPNKTIRDIKKMKTNFKIGGLVENRLAESSSMDTICFDVTFNEKALQYILLILQSLATGYNHLVNFRGRQAILAFNGLPSNHYHTGFVFQCLGKVYFEMVDYAMSETIFERMKQNEPYRLEGMEIYSTLLWHLQKDSQLSNLAHNLLEFDKKSPQTWCAVGNSFSLQKDHESALKCFQRAIQLDPQFTYAYTLSGHEHVSNEDFEKASVCFRNAIRIDHRHYNAWYGLGMIFYRQEKYELAEFHFKKALETNPTNSVLYCYLGMVLHATKQHQEALKVFDIAGEVDPRNPLVKFKKAKLLFSLEKYEAALEQLVCLKQIAPKESAVFFLMGQIYKKLGDKQKAMTHFTWAYDLDPKGSSIIKEAIDGNEAFTEDEADTPIHQEGYCGTTSDYCSPSNCQQNCWQYEKPRVEYTPKMFVISSCVNGKTALAFDALPNKFTSGKSLINRQLASGYLDYLQEKNIKASFFITGNRVINSHSVELLKRIQNDGHLIGIASWDIVSFLLQSDDEIRNQLIATEELLREVIGIKADYVKPPFDEIDDRVQSVIFDMGYSIVVETAAIHGEKEGYAGRIVGSPNEGVLDSDHYVRIDEC